LRLQLMPNLGILPSLGAETALLVALCRDFLTWGLTMKTWTDRTRRALLAALFCLVAQQAAAVDQTDSLGFNTEITEVTDNDGSFDISLKISSTEDVQRALSHLTLTGLPEDQLQAILNSATKDRGWPMEIVEGGVVAIESGLRGGGSGKGVGLALARRREGPGQDESEDEGEGVDHGDCVEHEGCTGTGSERQLARKPLNLLQLA